MYSLRRSLRILFALCLADCARDAGPTSLALPTDGASPCCGGGSGYWQVTELPLPSGYDVAGGPGGGGHEIVVNNAGLIFADANAPGGLSAVLVWTGSKWVDLQLPTNTTNDYYRVRDVNEAGQVLIETSHNPILWSLFSAVTVPANYPNIGAVDAVSTTGVTESGTVWGSRRIPNTSTFEVFSWSPASGTTGWAWPKSAPFADVSDNDWIVGYGEISAPSQTSSVLLKTLGPNTVVPHPVAINEARTLVVGDILGPPAAWFISGVRTASAKTISGQGRFNAIAGMRAVGGRSLDNFVTHLPITTLFTTYSGPATTTTLPLLPGTTGGAALDLSDCNAIVGYVIGQNIMHFVKWTWVGSTCY